MRTVLLVHVIFQSVRFLGLFVVVLAVLIFVTSLWMRMNHIYINTTPSLPLGFYKIIDGPIHKGAHVAFCPPQTELFDYALARGYIGSGNCPGGYSLLLKRVLAMAGDIVSIDQAGIAVNGDHLLNSAQLKADANNLPLPQYRLGVLLDDAEYLLVSDLHSHSFDARYFGLITRNQIQHVVSPVFTWSPTLKELIYE